MYKEEEGPGSRLLDAAMDMYINKPVKLYSFLPIRSRTFYYQRELHSLNQSLYVRNHLK